MKRQEEREVMFPHYSFLLLTTDLDSHIKYVNEHFCEIAGFTLNEMTGNPHRLVRHPAMGMQGAKLKVNVGRVTDASQHVNASDCSTAENGALIANSLERQTDGVSGECLELIQVLVAELAELNRNIATAIEEQSIVAEQVSENLNQVRQLSEVSGRHGVQSKAMSHSLRQQIDQQTALIS